MDKKTLTVRNYRLEKLQLLLELDGKMAIIMTNADKSDISSFVKFTWEQHHFTVFVAIIRLIH